jgi:putative ubiquitin-RnfH superfamily antitoxin RatB of RatAB toxin-antitoxin module
MPRMLQVTLAYAAPGIERLLDIRVPEGTTIAQAVAACGFPGDAAGRAAALEFAIFGQRAAPETLLSDGDRVELTRALRVDPKNARAARARARPLPKVGPRRKATRGAAG